MILSRYIFIAGILHILLVAGSLMIPLLLNWKQELSKVSSLIRQMFYTYAGYILMTNLWFGLISVLAPGSLVNTTFLATAVTLFIAFYWLARLLIQFFYFDRTATPNGWFYIAGEIALVFMFVFFTFVYSYAFWHNISSPS